MAAFDTTRPAYGSNGLVGRVALLFQTVAATFIGWNDARVTRNALVQLTDRELNDIGLVRGDIDLVAETQTRR